MWFAYFRYTIVNLVAVPVAGGGGGGGGGGGKGENLNVIIHISCIIRTRE